MRLLSFFFSIVAGLSLSVNVAAQQLAPERTFEEMLEALPREDVRLLTKQTLAREETSALMNKLSDILKAKEVGKKWTFRFSRTKGGNLHDTNETGTQLYSVVTGSVRVNGISYQVSVTIRADPALKDKVKQCAASRKIFVSGTVDGAIVTSASSPHLSLYVTADDLGRGKD